MRELKVGESYGGEDLAEILGIEDGRDDRFFAFGNNEKVVVARDEGNDNYEVLAICHISRGDGDG